MMLSSYDMMMAGIAANGKGMAKENFVRACLRAYEASEAHAEMREAERYAQNRNDIAGRRRMAIGERGVPAEAKNLANNRIAHPFLRRLAMQKVGYLLSRPFSLQTDDGELAERLGAYFTKDFRRMLQGVGMAAVTHGIAWLQAYYDEDGALCFARRPATEIVPLWRDEDHTRLDAVLRAVEVEVLEKDGSSGDSVRQLEYYDAQGVTRYPLDDGQDDMPEAIEGEALFMVDGQPGGWGRIPFIPFKYHADETPLLRYVKPLIDAYDRAVSDAANLIEDVPNAIKVVKGYSGTSPGEFIRNLATYRTAFVEGDGDLSALATPLDLSAVEQHLSRLKADIYEAGAGVDTQGIRLSNVSSETLRMMYNNLDMDCGSMASEFSAAMEDVIWFVLDDWKRRGQGDFTGAQVEIVWNTDIAVNQSETVEVLLKSAGMLSRETLLAQHPLVGDVKKELWRIAQEQHAAGAAADQ